MAQLRVTSSVLNGQAFNLEGEYYTIGREADNTISLPHQSISKHHAMITVDKGDFKLWDLHSTNGIVINGEKTVLRHLKDGDKIVLGDVEFLFTTNGLPTPPKPAPQAETQRIVLGPPISKPAPTLITKPSAPVEMPPVKVPVPVISQPPHAPPEANLERTANETVVAPVVIQAPTPKIETPVVVPVPATGLKSIPPVDSSPPEVSPSKAETKEIHLPPTPPDVPKIKVSMELHPRTPPTPVPATPEPSKSIADLPKDLTIQTPEPEPQPVAAAPHSTPARRSTSDTPASHRLIYLTMFLAGLGVLMTGYGFNITGCKFIGFILAVTGFICLYFAVRFKGIVAPPR